MESKMRHDFTEYIASKTSDIRRGNSLTKYPIDSARLKKAIKESNYTITQLSRAVTDGANPSLLYHWIDGSIKRVTQKTAMILCELLDLPFEYLFHPDSSSDLILQCSDLEEIKKLLISINNGIANLCKKWD